MFEIEDFFNRLSKEKIKEINEKQMSETKKDFIKFKKALEEGSCGLCNSKIDTFNIDNPCLHWLLRPNGIKKKDLNKLFESGVGYFRLSAYLRWIANIEAPMRNINNLRDEVSKKRKFELTIQYKNVQWSLSCAESDFHGHPRPHGNFPHYHLEMRIDGNVFIRFGEFHIPFSDEDIFTFRAIQEAPNKFKQIDVYGMSLQEAFDFFGPESFLDQMYTTKNPKDSTCSLQTIVMAPQGKTISGNTFAELAKESKETGIPMAKLLKKLDVKIQTIISPGEGVPKLKKRKPSRR